MKKLIALLLALVLCLSLCACGSKQEEPEAPAAEPAETPAEEPAAEPEAPAEEPVEAPAEEPETPAVALAIGDSIDNDNFTMTFDSIELVDEYSFSTSEYSTTSLYVESGYKLLVLKGHFENKSTAAISDSAFVRSAVINDSFEVDGFDVSWNFIRDKYFEIDPYTDLDYVISVNVPEKLAEMFETVTFNFSFNDDMSIPATVWNVDGTKTVDAAQHYALTGGLTGAAEGTAEGAAPEGGETAAAATPIAIGDTIVTDDVEFTLTGVELTYEVLPPNTSSVYMSYAAESGKVYVHVAADVKNVMQRDIRIDELFNTSVLYDGKYPYTGFTAVNNGDNSFDWVGSYVAATPLETCKAHGIVECPAEVDTAGGSIVVSIELAGTVYEYTLR